MSGPLFRDEKALLRAGIREARVGRTGGLDAQVPGGLRGPTPHDTEWPEVLIGYAALPGEPSADAVLDAARAAGVRVMLPATIPGEPLRFGPLLGPMADVVPHGKWQIREPGPEFSAAEAVARATGAARADAEAVWAESGRDRPVTVLVPGLGFGADGYRLGNGGGFYDRTFGPKARLWDLVPAGTREHMSFVGVCWEDETGLEVPREPWDLRVDRVVWIRPD